MVLEKGREGKSHCCYLPKHNLAIVVYGLNSHRQITAYFTVSNKQEFTVIMEAKSNLFLQTFGSGRGTLHSLQILMWYSFIILCLIYKKIAH